MNGEGFLGCVCVCVCLSGEANTELSYISHPICEKTNRGEDSRAPQIMRAVKMQLAVQKIQQTVN